MLKKAVGLGIAFLCLALVKANAGEAVLGMGDPAPKLTVAKFVKGTPVTKFEKGKLYVVEFWATWCGPCRTSIPHLTELQKKYKDVTFIGVSVFEQDQAGVAPFVKEMGDKMDYRVAMDDVPAGKKGDGGLMATGWMEAAKQEGIPTAFVINKESQIAWIGHPMMMEEPLKKIVAGKWDAKAEGVRIKKQAELGKQLQQAMQSQNTGKALSLLDQGIADDPGMEAMYGPVKLAILRLAGKDKEAATYGTKLVETILKDDAETLNSLAWEIVDPEAQKKPTPELLAFALKAAKRADAVKEGKDSAIADTLAKAYFDNGNIDKAIEAQTRAVALAKGTPLEKDTTLNDRLEQYKKAKK